MIRFILLALLIPVFSFGDAMVMTRAMSASTIAEVFIERDVVRVVLEIGVQDIAAFKNMLPDAIYENIGNTPRPLAERLAIFFSEDVVVDADGKRLNGSIRQMEPRQRLLRDEITGETLPGSGDGEQVLYVEMVYPLTTKAATLSFKPPMRDGRYASATIGMMVYHQNLPVMDFRYLSQKEILTLDWEDPWYSRFENKNLWRQYNEPISVFLYAEPFETRVEVIVRPKDIQQWADLGMVGLETIPVEKQPELKTKVAEFLKGELNLKLDGEPVTPELQRVNFLKRTLKSSVVIDPPEELDAISATLGVIFSAPTAALPKESSVTWNLFSQKMQVVRAAATDEAGPLPYRIVPDDNVLVWKNFLKNPTLPGIKPLPVPAMGPQFRLPRWVGLLIALPLIWIINRKLGRLAAGGGLVLLIVLAFFFRSTAPVMADEEKEVLLQGLLSNVYASFDFNGESAVYDALEQSLSGDLLSQVYLETMKSLELASQGGARVKVKEITVQSSSFDGSDQEFFATTTWDVKGSVGHWGHIHERINRYSAELNVEPLDGKWKITRLDVLEEQRIK